MCDRNSRRRGLTLVELLLAVSILAIISTFSYLCFDTVVHAWRTGVETANASGQAEYVLDQLTAALRSAYYPNTGSSSDEYGFAFYDGGDGERTSDTIEWTKTGASLVGEDAGFAEIPHRTVVSVMRVGNRRNGNEGLCVKAWRQALNPDDFDPQDVEWLLLAPRVIGFNCRMLDKDNPIKNDMPNWVDEWTHSNTLPSKVELTLYLSSPDDGKDKPLVMRRIVDIPMAEYSQNPQDAPNSGNSTRGGGGGRRP